MMENNDAERDVVELLRRMDDGLTITKIVTLSRFSRSTIRVILARLEGADRVSFREIGMAKVYHWEEYYEE